jgi:hypothetical protein
LYHFHVITGVGKDGTEISALNAAEIRSTSPV